MIDEYTGCTPPQKGEEMGGGGDVKGKANLPLERGPMA